MNRVVQFREHMQTPCEVQRKRGYIAQEFQICGGAEARQGHRQEQNSEQSWEKVNEGRVRCRDEDEGAKSEFFGRNQQESKAERNPKKGQGLRRRKEGTGERKHGSSEHRHRHSQKSSSTATGEEATGQ